MKRSLVVILCMSIIGLGCFNQSARAAATSSDQQQKETDAPKKISKGLWGTLGAIFISSALITSILSFRKNRK